MRQWLLPVTAAVAVGGMIAAGVRMVLTRRTNPLLDAGTGVAALAAAATLGVAVPSLLLQAGDEWSSYVLNASTDGMFTGHLSSILAMAGTPDVVVIVFGIFALVMATVQAALLLFRQAAVIILAAVLPLAAAGATAPMTRGWIRKIVSWMLALIAYKPAAAAVYAATFTMIGKGHDLRTVIMGFVMLALSLVAMPVLMRFFTWTTGAVSSGGGGGQFLGMAAAGAVAAGALRGSSGGAGAASASQHASYLSSRQQSGPSAQADGAASSGAGVGNSTPVPPPDVPSRTAGDSAGNAAAVARTSPAGPVGPAAAGAPVPAAGAGASGAAAAGAAGPAIAAVIAGQALASGARNAAAGASQEGDQR